MIMIEVAHANALHMVTVEALRFCKLNHGWTSISCGILLSLDNVIIVWSFAAASSVPCWITIIVQIVRATGSQSAFLCLPPSGWSPTIL
ncbi:hypothetical protein BDW74DRAFT_164182 [Aspergillus multicolor]|uniref:uncharacterized protein n=1 Tax=Aspergillus multicolor TaxID=41759 RepID=UPI003CCD48B5